MLPNTLNMFTLNMFSFLFTFGFFHRPKLHIILYFPHTTYAILLINFSYGSSYLFKTSKRIHCEMQPPFRAANPYMADLFSCGSFIFCRAGIVVSLYCNNKVVGSVPRRMHIQITDQYTENCTVYCYSL